MKKIDYSKTNEAPPYDGWHWKKDPFGLLKVNDKIGNAFVKGFCTPAGKEIDRLMVLISHTKNGSVATTRDYLTLLGHIAEFNRKSHF